MESTTSEGGSSGEKNVGSEILQKNRMDSIFLRDNINKFSDQLFRENAKQFSRYNIERRWRSVIKADGNAQRSDQQQQTAGNVNELTYWKYAARQMNRAVSEPNLQTARLLGTNRLVRCDTFHDLRDFGWRVKGSVAVEPFKPTILTWVLVTKDQCISIGHTKTDKELLKIFDDVFEWKTTNEKKIMTRLFADMAKHCKKYELSDEKMSALLGIYWYTHLFNTSLSMLSFEMVYGFFKELIIRHSVLAPPDHINLFSVEEARSHLTHFLNKYLICLSLIRHICVPNSILHVKWKRNYGSDETNHE